MMGLIMKVIKKVLIIIKVKCNHNRVSIMKVFLKIKKLKGMENFKEKMDYILGIGSKDNNMVKVKIYGMIRVIIKVLI